MNKCSFEQRFTANKHAAIRYKFKTSFFGLIALLAFVKVSKRVFQQSDNFHLDKPRNSFVHRLLHALTVARGAIPP
ncbi:hypothetical protein [Paenibacillus sp. IITD108]|uniref:hypothetical protein n=1 Tax=Paenibacillus sp. IITD108 TaxID=3116649 RepID=UPI002F3E5FB6